MCGGKSSAPQKIDYAGQKAAADAETAKITAEKEKQKAADDAKLMLEKQVQANQEAAAAAKRRLLISQSLDDKGQALESADPAVRLAAQKKLDEEDDPLDLTKAKKKKLLVDV